MKIVFLPIDNRPVCYQMPKMICKIHKGLEFVLPKINLLGGLRSYSDRDGLFEWLKASITDADAVVISLDTIAWGGLISSRRSEESIEEVFSRLEKLKSILKSSDAKIYAFSSIMRISNNNVNEEEKDYWSLYGEKIFKYSYEFDKNGQANTDVPKDILDDYIKTRKRNFEVNKLYLQWQKEGLFDTLIFSKDDCAEFGLNVIEARELEKLGGFTKTGADEIPLSLLAKAIPCKINVCPIFTEPGDKHLISNYEDVSIEKSVLSQLELCGCNVTDEKVSDLILYVNNFKKNQGEIVMKRSTEPYSGNWSVIPYKAYMIADVRFANGADNNLVKQIFERGLDRNFYGYSGWNTSANTLGSLICAAKVVYYAKKANKYDMQAFKDFETIRFLDDWAYQANVRQKLDMPDEDALKSMMALYEDLVKSVLETEFKTRYSFPWSRLFEVEIELI